jgi:glycosyltransferase involved in cell wall biosynthesis
MKVLFVSRGNAKHGISPIVESQGVSLMREGVQLSYFTIMGKGFFSYFHHIFVLRKYLKSNKFDLVHVHYSLSAYVATLAFAHPLIVSLMGSDIKSSSLSRRIIKTFCILAWKNVIVKSDDLRVTLNIRNINLLPNGVDITVFKEVNQTVCKNQLNWSLEKKHILFAADPARPEKNYSLAQKSLNLLDSKRFEVHFLKNVSHVQTPVWYNAADIVLLTSLWEGSPNVVKEAMACCRPIVCTDMGDIRWLFGNEHGHYISDFVPENIANMIKLALDFSHKNGRTKGRTRIIELGLDSISIAKRIVNIYNTVLIK